MTSEHTFRQQSNLSEVLRSSCLVVLIMVIATQTFAQPISDRILIPIWFRGDLPGAYGSLWRVEFSVVNHSDTPIRLEPYTMCENMDACPITKELPPGSTVFPPLWYWSKGYVLSATEGRAKDLDFTLRIREISRGSLDWGTEIPVVRESEMITGALSLPDIPVASEFRSTLRVYGLEDFEDGRRVHVAVYAVERDRDWKDDDPPDPLLFETTLVLGATGLPDIPQYSEFPLSDNPELTASPRVRVLVTPEDPSWKYWAFVSVTHNDTQRITTVTP